MKPASGEAKATRADAWGEGFDRAGLVRAPGPGFVRKRSVLFQEIDAAGVLFHARIFDWFHDTYAALLDASGLPLHRIIEAREWWVPLVHVEAHYLGALRLGDAVDVAIVRARVDGSRVRFGYRVVGEGGDVRAVGVTDHMFIQGATRERIPVPEPLARACLAIHDLD